MKRFLLLFFITYSSLMFSQHYGNEWIKPGLKYYKIAVVSKGIHRVTFTDLSKAGVPVGDINPKYLQLFKNGEEQYIYVSGESDQVFNGNDYFEFYGEPNTGWFDSVFYNNPSELVNPNYSLVNDTSWYFMTWNSIVIPNRFQTENDINFAAYSPTDYCFREVRQDYTSYYNTAEEGSYYSDGEGWVGDIFGIGDKIIPTSVQTIATPNYISKSIKSDVSFCIVGANSLSHRLQVLGLGLTVDTPYTGYKTIKINYQSSNNLTASSVLTAKALSASTDKNAWAWFSIRYTHSMDFENSKSFLFTLPKINGSKYRLDITKFTGDTATVFYDLTSHKRIKPTNNLGTYQLLLKNEGKSPNCIISSGTDFKSPVTISAISSRNADPGNFAEFKFLKSSFIIITNKALWSKAKEYADYRKSTGQSVVLLDVDEVYNQFGYGINKHPGAIRNFCRYAMKYSSVKPEYLFLIGKSIHTKDYRKNPSIYGMCLVPSAGQPVSDALFTWRLNGTSYAPAIATGRLAATSLSDVDLYLNKVKEYEKVQPSSWMKNILQFSGGKDIGEQTVMKNFVLGYQKIFEDTLFGANIQNFFKNTSQPIGSTQTDIIKQSINSGVSILNFFGHAAATGFDQNIDLPTSYENKGKYPFLIANSCYSGDINNAGVQGISEQWVLIKDKGTIGFLANVDVGYAYFLDIFSKELVNNISYKNYQGSIGKSIVNTIARTETMYNNSSYMCITSLDMTLHGDPAIKIYGFNRPDLVAYEKNISFTPNLITTEIDSFQVNYTIVNEARAFTDSFKVQIKRTYPNGKITTKMYWIAGVKNKKTLTFNLPIGGLSSAGINKIEITLDPTDTIFELNETNNTITHTFLINSSEILPVYPYKYAIYPLDTVEFKACSPNPYITSKNAICQLDVSGTFNSAELITATSQYTDGLFTWKFPKKFIANKVYYWRVAIDNGDGNPKWNASSFIYIPGKTGWSQADFYQFNDDDYKYMKWNEPAHDFAFIKTPKRINCSTMGGINLSHDDGSWKYVQFSLDGSLLGWSSCDNIPAFNVAVFDSLTLVPWKTNRGNFGARDCPVCHSAGDVVLDYFAFTSSDASQRNAMISMLKDSVPNGDYILLFTWGTGHFASIDDNFVNFFKTQGSKQIENLRTSGDSKPYIFFIKKGSPETMQEIVGANERFEMNVDVFANYNKGNINSTLIGPSKHWSSFKQDISADNTDINRFTISQINQKNQEHEILTQLQNNVDTLDKVIDASINPYLRLSLSTNDDANRTPGQLKSWQIYYDETPEGAVSITPKTMFYADTVQEGENVKMIISFKNISSQIMDSVLLNYTITNGKNELIQFITKRLKPLAPNVVLTDSIVFNSSGHTGNNLLTVEFNPFNSLKGTYDQLEQYHFNNIAQKTFYVKKDKRNPLFDVTFDGVHIMNGDIVSAKPTIKINLKDENKYFAIDDTSLIQVYIKSMNDNTERKVSFTSGEMSFVPGTSANNKATITFSPLFTQEGIYQLRIIGKDKSGNSSGKSDYVTTFEVITKSSISNLINYPNPFSTSTRFIFTLTGSEIPSDLRIQIFTITGKMIKEISMADLGSLHIGRNITPLAWDGTDSFGDKLANGVYLYRVISSINGSEIEHRSSEVDQYFKKGFGKMYLMR